MPLPGTIVRDATKVVPQPDLTRGTCPEIQAFLEVHFPLETKVDGQLKSNEQNKKLHTAFKSYYAAANKPNIFYHYIMQHVGEGFSPEEWSILSAGITFRAEPTYGDLLHKDTVFNNAGIHAHFARNNGHEEGGTATTDSHIKLLYDSLTQMSKHLPGKLPFIDNVVTFNIVQQLLLFRKEGLKFEVKTEHHTDPTMQELQRDHLLYTDLHHQCERFNALCKERGLTLPHMVRAAWKHQNPHQINTPFDGAPLFEEGSSKGPQKWFMDSGSYTEVSLTENIAGPYRGEQDHGLKEFDAAQKIVALLSDEKFLNYGIGTRKNQQIGDPNNPSDAKLVLCNALDLVAREANDKGHVDAFLALGEAHLGYIPSVTERKTAYKWPWIHVGEHAGVTHGVEPDHAKDALTLFMTLAHANKQNAPALTEAFNFVVDQGYLKIQHDHMQHIVDAMQAARDRAIEKAKVTGESPFIAPKPYVPDPNQGRISKFLLGTKEAHTRTP